MFKVAAKPKHSSTDASMLANILWQFKGPTWIQEFPNARIAGNGVMLYSHARFKDPSTSNAMVLTNLKTTANLGGAAKQMRNLTHPDSKRRKESHALTHPNAQTAEVIIKPTPTCVHSGDIGSTESGNKRNILRSMITGPNQFVLRQTASSNNDYMKSQSFFAKCLEKFAYHQHHSWDSELFWYYLHSRTPLVKNS